MNFDFDFDRQDRIAKRKRILFKIFRWVLVLGFTITSAWLITEFAVEKTNMVGDSMSPTLLKEDTILVNRLAYINGTPERFDIIVFMKNGKEHSYYGIKRVIGLPGETVQIIEGVVYINGEPIEEQVNVEPIVLPGLAENPIVLDDDEYFVLGDNRNDSEDSRFANIGNVVEEEIIGTAWLRTNKFGIISKLNLKSDAEEENTEADDADNK